MARAQVIALILPALAGASFPAAANVDLTSGNATFTINEAIQATVNFPFNAPNGDAALRLDGAASPDVLYKYCWYYKTPISSSIRLFSDLLAPTRTVSGDTATFTWTSNGDGVAGGPGRFDAVLTVRLTDGASPTQARVASQMRIRSAAASPTTIRIYHLVDLDLPGGLPNPGPDDTLALTGVSPLEARYTESSTANYALVDCPGADHHRIDSGLALRTQLQSTLTDLAAESGPYSGDGAVASEWTLSLAPGEERTIEAVFTINMPAAAPPCRADFNASGALTVQDIFDFLIAYFSNAPGADINSSGGVTVQDIFDYLILYFQGC